MKKSVAGREGHLLDLTNIPGADDEPPAVRILFNLLDDLIDLVDAAAIDRAPITPLRAIDATEIAIGIGPFIPNSHAVLIQIFDVRVSSKEPEQFVNDRFEMEFFGGESGKTILERKASLGAEDGISSGASAVGLEFAVVQNQAEQIEILNQSLGQGCDEAGKKPTKREGPQNTLNTRKC